MSVPISNVTRRQVYAPSGAGGAGPYAFTFEILANTDIAVYKDDVLLTLTTHYTVTINANGTGSVTITATGLALAPTSPTQYAIVGNRTISRTTDFTTGGDFFANTLNDELDQQTIFAQQNAEGLQRALSAPQTDPTSINMTLPRAALRAGKNLAFDDNGNPTLGDTLGTNRGNWAASTLYYVRDIIKDTSNNNIWQCLVQHTSSGSQPINTNADSAKWSLLVDAASATTSANNAANSASAASTSAGNASTSETNASNSATLASQWASLTTGQVASTDYSSKAWALGGTGVTDTASRGAAKEWATKTGSTVDGTEYSAKHYASAASTSAGNASSSATAAAGSASSAAASAAAAATALDNFDDRYLGQKASDPTLDNDGNALLTGALYFNTTNRIMRVYDGTQWLDASSALPVVMKTYTFVATAGQTVFTGNDVNSSPLAFTAPYLIVSLNGVELRPTADYTTTSGNTVTLTSAAALNDEVQIQAFTSFNVANIQADNVTFLQAGTGAVSRSTQAKMRDTVSVKDFGAVGDGVTDDTLAIQRAIDYGYLVAKAVFVPSGTYICGQITTYPTTTIIGEGRQATNFACKAGTTGKWWSDRGNGAQKLMLSGLAWYANNEAGLTHGAEFGNTGVQFGTEGILQNLWFRDVPNGYALLCNGNVGFFETITTQNSQYGAKILGNANQVQNLVAMECDTIAVDLSGCDARGVHVEATLSGGVPIKIYGDSSVHDLVISSANGASHSMLIEVDNSVYTAEWAVENVLLLGTGYTVTNGILKVGANYYGGTTPSAFSGASYKPQMRVYGDTFEVKYQQLQCFTLRIYNNAGTLQHRITDSNGGVLPTFSNKITGASATYQNTPTATDATTAFAFGGKISTVLTNGFIFNTAAQVPASGLFIANIVYNNTGTAMSALPIFDTLNVNGVTRNRLLFTLYNPTTGASVPINTTNIPAGKVVDISFLGCLQ